MAESYSVRATLSATDSNFTSTFNRANKATESLGSKIKSGLGFGALAGLGYKAMNTISTGVGDVINELSSASAAWKTFEGNMEMLGQGKKEIASTKKELQQFATQTIYSASDMATTYSQLAAVGTKNCTKLVKGFGGLAAAAENPTQAMKTLSTQATQMAAKPKVAWMDFKLMLEQTPAGIAAVAKKMGKTTSQLVSDVQDGTVATEEFLDAVAEVGTNDSFTKLATSYKTVDQAMDGLKETLSTQLGPAFDVASQYAINAVSGIIDWLGKIDAQKVADDVKNAFETARPYIEKVTTAVKTVATALGKTFNKIASNQTVIDGFSGAMDLAGQAVDGFASFLSDNADTIAEVTPYAIALLGAFKGFKVVKSIVGSLTSFASGLTSMATSLSTGLATKLTATAAAQTATGTASAASAPQILAAGAALLMLGAGVALAAGGLYLLVQGAIQIASAGAPAAVALGALTLALGALAVGASVLGPALTAGAVGFIAFGAAIALVGVGALAAGAGLALVSGALPAIVEYGLQGSVSIGALALAITAIGVASVAGAAGLIALGVGAVGATAGIIAFGVGMTASAIGVGVMALALVAVNSSMKSIAKNAKEAGTSISNMKKGVSIINEGLDALKSKAKNAFNSFVSIFQSSTPKVTTEASKMAKGMVTGLQTGFVMAQTVARTNINQITSIMSQGANGAMSAGRFIGQGLAIGMQSALGQVRSVANELAAEAEKAIRAKAKIHSPSKVTTSLGEYWGEGFANGISDMANKVKAVSSDLLSIPQAQTPNLAFAGGGSLSDDYNYNTSVEYTINVPLSVDGREFAKATGGYIQEENDKTARLKNYLKGVK